VSARPLFDTDLDIGTIARTRMHTLHPIASIGHGRLGYSHSIVPGGLDVMS
jgi:hypothetical protein